MKIKIQVLGSGCPKCKMMASQAEEAAWDLGLDFELSKVTNPGEIMESGVLLTPALVIDGVVRIQGKVPGIDEMKTILAR